MALPMATWLSSSGQTSTFILVVRATAMMAARIGAWSCSFIASLRASLRWSSAVIGLCRISQYGV